MYSTFAGVYDRDNLPSTSQPPTPSETDSSDAMKASMQEPQPAANHPNERDAALSRETFATTCAGISEKLATAKSNETSTTCSSEEQHMQQQQQPEEHRDDASDATDAHKNTTSDQAIDRMPVVLDCIERGEWRQMTTLLEQDPSLARRQVTMVVQGENSKCLLVHKLCGLQDTPIFAIDALLTLNPAALLQRDQRGGRLPIHIAVVKDAPLELVEYLCRARPQALEHKDMEGNLPLHYAAMHGSSDILKLLVDSYPTGCGVVNTRDRFPIHLVCDRCFDTDTIPTQHIDQIIQAYPDALMEVDRLGRTPLHLAASVQHPQLQVIQLLVAKASAALLVKDKARKTPLVCAKTGCGHKFAHKANDLVVSSLVESTQQEQRRKRNGKFSKFWISGVMGSSSSRKLRQTASKEEEHDVDLYCCYG